MPPHAPARLPGKIDRFKVQVRLGAASFPVPVCARPLELGPGVKVQHYWIDKSLLKVPRSRRSNPSDLCTNIVWHYLEAMRLQGGVDDSVLRNVLLAACYQLVSTDKGPQRVYRDACLRSKSTKPEEVALPDDIRSHIKCVVARRDRESVRAELEELFAPAVPSPADTQALTQAFDGILDWGVRAARERGQAGGADFANLLDHWVTIKRKRGGDDFTRALLDHLSYQCKQAFYLCYTNLWISLIPSLREHRGLDEISERFLRFWHMQNQPVELPDGRVLPDVFGGQVLALHPLSGFIMQDPALSAVAGNFFATDAYTATFTRGQAAACAEYWALVEVILTAAHLYRRANGEQEQARSRRTRRGVEGLAAPAGGPCAEALLERLAEARGWFCPSCGGPLRHVGVDRGAGSDAATLEYACRSCGTPVRKAQHYEELRSSLA
jgi:hypothetical protein